MLGFTLSSLTLLEELGACFFGGIVGEGRSQVVDLMKACNGHVFHGVAKNFEELPAHVVSFNQVRHDTRTMIALIELVSTVVTEGKCENHGRASPCAHLPHRPSVAASASR